MAAFLGKTQWQLGATIHIGCLSNSKDYRHAPCPILKMSVNGVSTIIGVGSWVIQVLQCGNNSQMELWQPFQLKQRTRHTLHHQETECQWSVNNIWSCILGNQGFVRIAGLITELLTASIAKNAINRRQKAYSKIINVTYCKTSKKRLLAVEYQIVIMYNYPTAKTRTLYKSRDGPAGRPADNTPNPDGLGYLHQTLPELTVQIC